MFGDGPVEVAGQMSRRGRLARSQDGGYRLTGSYGFGSGAGHAAWLGGAARPLDCRGLWHRTNGIVITRAPALLSDVNINVSSFDCDNVVI
jgi:hypothetical protein